MAILLMIDAVFLSPVVDVLYCWATAMADVEALLTRWQTAGVLEAESAERIRAFESEDQQPAGLRWQGKIALILGALLLAGGVVLFVSAHWNDLGPGARFSLVLAMIAVFHLAGGSTRASFKGLSTSLHAVGTVATGAGIALVGQIFNIQEHWPAAVLMWAFAALAGWIFLQDEVQQSLTLLLFPSWVYCEFAESARGHIGQDAYLGRFLVVWAMLYLTLFLGSHRKVARGITFASAAVAGLFGTGLLLEGWRSWSSEQTLIPSGTRFWGWFIIAALPLIISVIRFRKTSIPVIAALIFSVSLPWCQRIWTKHFDVGNGYRTSFVRSDPNLLAHALVAAFAVFIIWWGVHHSSRALVNIGIVYFAIAVGWFYFSNVFDKVGRSLGLIGLGILFLAGGWILDKTRRRLLAYMPQASISPETAR
jgi:uncharacterized membrane protein